jgi:hypothetical protein
MRALALIPRLQITGVITSLRLVRSWQRDPGHRPSRGRMATQHLLLPLILNLALAAVPIYFLFRKMLGYLRLFMPDVYWTALFSGGLAGVWTIVRTGLILHTLRKKKASKKIIGWHKTTARFKRADWSFDHENLGSSRGSSDASRHFRR